MDYGFLRPSWVFEWSSQACMVEILGDGDRQCFKRVKSWIEVGFLAHNWLDLDLVVIPSLPFCCVFYIVGVRHGTIPL